MGGNTMHRKRVRAAARTAAVGGTLVLGLGIAPAAMAQPPVTVHVACYAGAIAAAISGATGGETIALTPGCVYRLDAALPDVAVDMTIVGYDTELLGYHSDFPLLSVGASVDLTVVDVDFKDGGGSGVDGGAIYIPAASDVTVDGGIFTDNYGGDGYGGAISNYGRDDFLTVNGAYFIDNDGAYYGGAIYNYGTTTINGSTFEKNVSPDEDGGAIYNEGVMRVTGSTFTGNSSYYGAIYNEPYAGGGLLLNRDDITGNVGVYGGGLYNDADTVTVNNSLIDFNIATDDGGGIYNDAGTTTVSRSQIYGNRPDNCVDVSGCFG